MCNYRLNDDNNDKLYQETEIKPREYKSIYVIPIQKCGPEKGQETTNVGETPVRIKNEKSWLNNPRS